MHEALGVIPAPKKKKDYDKELFGINHKNKFRKCWISDECGFHLKAPPRTVAPV
jgi:hypothetical protein